MLADGDIDEAIRLAERLVAARPQPPLARLVLGVRALKQKQYAAAKQNLPQSVRGPITDLAGTLLAAWAQYGADDSKGAIEAIDKLQGAEWYALFKDLHAGLILDLAGNKKEAGKRFERAYKLDTLGAAPGRGLWLLAVAQRQQGRGAQGLPVVRRAVAASSADRRGDGKRQGAASSCRRSPIRRRRAPPKCSTASARRSAAAAARTSASSIFSSRSISRPISRWRCSRSPISTSRSRTRKLAIKFYERVPQSSPLRRNAEIQLAVNLDTLDRTDEAKKRLNKLITEQPANTEAIMALGNIQRGRKEFDDCADVYSKGIATIDTPERPHWLIYYFRGICNERAKKWAAAEADLKMALKLYPDQPHVLNYLGYSWVDQGVNLDEGMRMIRRAVEQRPDDGYIVDSLGWAYYRLGNYDEAVKHLERAVELKPDDPTINDHLGDGYWKTGRFLEAQFQWSHAKDLKPEPEDLEKIEQKLKTGLPEETSSAADASKQKKPGNGG